MTEDERRRRRRDHAFKLRSISATEGTHFPTTEELLRGMAFFGGKLENDLQSFAQRLLPSLREREEPILAILIGALEQACLLPDLERLRQLERCLGAARDHLGPRVPQWLQRVQIYLANLEDQQAAFVLASEYATRASASAYSQDTRHFVQRALGWLCVAAYTPSDGWVFRGMAAEYADRQGRLLVSEIETYALEARNRETEVPESADRQVARSGSEEERRPMAVAPPDADEPAAARSSWPGGLLRKLKRFLEACLASRKLPRA